MGLESASSCRQIDIMQLDSSVEHSCISSEITIRVISARSDKTKWAILTSYLQAESRTPKFSENDTADFSVLDRSVK